ncbi:hypothetical protein BASA62_005473 [Batrachochytrium salamandrivorans]|nr:hypothetical protein BASA62_005473 [Batrachochytrium salamandrivorans]
MRVPTNLARILVLVAAATSLSVATQSIPAIINDDCDTISNHNLTVIITADDIFNLNIGGEHIRGPFDSPTVNTNAWKNINTYTQIVHGDGPFHISVDVADFGTVAGLMAAVYVDGKHYADTGTVGNQWLISDQTPISPSWWSDDVFQADSTWHTNVHDTCPDITYLWDDLPTRFQNAAPGSHATMITSSLIPISNGAQTTIAATTPALYPVISTLISSASEIPTTSSDAVFAPETTSSDATTSSEIPTTSSDAAIAAETTSFEIPTTSSDAVIAAETTSSEIPTTSSDAVIAAETTSLKSQPPHLMP